MANLGAGIFTQLLSLGGGLANGILGMFTSIMSSGFQAATKFHQEGIALGRDLGLGLNQANAYTKILTERTQELAAKYGVTSDAIKEVQRGISDATGKQLLLNDAQAESFVQANKLVGSQTTNKFIDTIMNTLGGQVGTVQGAISKAYATAAKQGLNAQKFSKTVADNLSMANRLNFRNGIDGITRMAAMAEKFGLNMKSVETAAGQFMELDSAIEHSAHLQMLGGSIGASFGNPLTNAYEAQYDPEAFAKRMEDAIKGMAKFDKSKGYATIDPMSQEILRNYAKEMGLNAEEVIGNAKKQAEVRYKETAFRGEISRVAGSGPEAEARKNFILNNSQVTPEGKLQVNGKNINDISEKEWQDMMAFDGKSDTDILKDQALSLKSIKEQLQGSGESVAAAFAKGLKLEEKAQPLINGIQALGRKVEGISENLGEGVGEAITGIFGWVNRNKDSLAKIANGFIKLTTAIGPIIKWVVENPWKSLFAFLGARTLVRAVTSGRGGRLAARAAKGVWGGIKSGAMGIWNTSRDMHYGTRFEYANARASGSGKIMSAIKAPFKGFGLLSGAQKLTTLGGAAFGVGLGAYKAFTADNNAERGAGIGTAVGSVIGTAIGGPLGTAIGGWLGGVGGKLIGEHWEGIKDFAKGAWEGIKDFAKGTWEGIKDFAKGTWEGIKDLGKWAFGLIPEDARKAISDGMKIITPIIKSQWELIKGFAFGAWEAIKGTAVGVWNIVKGTALGAWSVIKGAALGVWEIVKGGALGVWETVKGIWNGLWGLISAPFAAIADVANGIKDGVSQILNGQILNGILSIFGGVGKGIFDIISAPFKSVYDVGVGVFKGFAKVGEGVWHGIGAFAKGVWNGIGEWVKGIWNGVGSFVKGIWNGVLNVWYGIAKALNHLPWVNIDVPKEKKAYGGIVGGDSYSGDRILTGLNSGEMVLNRQQQAKLFGFINNASNVLTKVGSANGVTYYNASNGGYNKLSNILSKIFNTASNVISSALDYNNGIKTLPIGTNSFKPIPRSNDGVGYNDGGIKNVNVRDFNVNLSGTIRLDAGNVTKNLDLNALLEDTAFVSSLKDMIKQSINNDINNGRFMNDMASMRGLPSPITVWGRK